MAQTASEIDRYACSGAAFYRASRVLPGGVNSPVRAYQAVGRDPIVIRGGRGAIVTDLDGNEYVDFVGAYGPLILGHAPEPVLAALSKAAQRGTSFGMPTESETTLAQMVVDAVESIDRVRFVNSGTEAAMSAIRLARAATGRDGLIKCTGGYHGHADELLVQAGSGATTLGTPSSPGVPESTTSNTHLVPYNDPDATRSLLESNPDRFACMIVEPIAGNMGCVPPRAGYLADLRELCDRFDVLLLFDEVMSGFRVGFGGAQELYGVRPDLTCLGKVVGGGLPCAAYGGRDDLMRRVAPEGPVYQAGTLSGSPLAMAAGAATLDVLRDGSVFEQLETAGARLETGLNRSADEAGVPVWIGRVGSMLCCFFGADPVENYEQAVGCDTDRYATFFGSMLDQGVALPPSQFETWFVSAAHDESCIQLTLDAATRAFAACGRG